MNLNKTISTDKTAEELQAALLLQENNPVYIQADNLHRKAIEEQNAKAAAKYSETLNPDTWSAEELAGHAIQEAVDMERYIVALLCKFEGLERRIKYLEAENSGLLIAKENLEKEVRKAFSYGR